MSKFAHVVQQVHDMVDSSPAPPSATVVFFLLHPHSECAVWFLSGPLVCFLGKRVRALLYPPVTLNSSYKAC